MDKNNKEFKQKYDEHAKKILSNKMILAHILKRVVDGSRYNNIQEYILRRIAIYEIK